MTRRISTFALMVGWLTVTAASHAQTAAADKQADIQTLRASSRIVIVDVVVTDSKQNAVHGLKPSDFTLLEKGQPQTIAHFEEHRQMSAADAAKLPPIPKLEPGVFTNYSPAPQDGPVNILLFDALNTPMKDQAFVRQEMLKYLKAPRPATRMAIFGLSMQLHLLQGFTSDPELLRAVISGKKGAAKASALMDNAVSGDTVGQDTPMDSMIESIGNTPGGEAVAAQLAQFNAEQQSFQTMLRTRYTLDAMNLLGRYLSNIPGRKNLIWFSGSFPVNILPDGDLQNPFGVQADMEEEFHETVNLLSRSQVSVYPIDARGLMGIPMLDAANSGSKYVKNPGAYGKDASKFFTQTAQEHGTMLEMAEETGGKAFVNTNGLKEAVEKAVDAGSNYYTLTYTPTNKTWNGDYRRIEVKLAAQGYTLAYRRGYYADDPDAFKRGIRKDAATAPTTFEPLKTAMLFGGPDPTEIIFNADVIPATDTTETALAEDNHAGPKTAGPYRRYVAYFIADPKAITLSETAKGEHHLDLQFVAMVYNSEGAPVNSIGKRIVTDLNAAQYKALMQTGARYREDISVPAKGEYFLRLGVQDVATQHVGALELSIDQLSKVKSLASQQAAQAAAEAGKK